MLIPAAARNFPEVFQDMGTQTALAFSALLPLINPVGSALILLGLVGEAPEKVYRGLARKISLATLIFLVVIEVLGDAILRFFGLSLPVVQLAGGIVVASIGWGILNKADAQPSADKIVPPQTNYGSLAGRIFYPFTFPVTAGPGCIVLMLTLSAHASRPHMGPDLFAHAGIVIAVAILCVMVYFCYAYATLLTLRISASTVNGVQRIMGFIVLCIGVQIAWNGLEALVLPLLHSS